MDISDSPAKGCSFCKILFSEISLHDKMMIPEKFVRKYRKQLPVRVYLKVPGGAVWHVDLVGDGDKVWLQNGWPEFARFYSLCFGHFLVFKYQGNSHFDVFIYDKRGTEMDYPMDRTVPHMDEQGNLNLRKFTEVRKRVVIDIDELKACKKTRANSACIEAYHIGECPMRKLQHQKIAEVTSDKALVGRLDENTQPLDMLNPKKGEVNYHNTQQQGVPIIDITDMVLESSNNETDSSRKDMATQIEGTSATRPGLSGGFRMSAKGRLTKPLVTGLPAASHWEKRNHASSSKNGSRDKAKEKKGELYLVGSTTDKGKAKALGLAKDFKSKNPSFILTVLPSFVDRRSQVDIKRAFAQRYMRSNQNFKFALVNGKTWHVVCLAYRNRCRFGGGWSQFADGNALSIGDVCVFELVNRSQLLLEIFIYRAAKC